MQNHSKGNARKTESEIREDAEGKEAESNLEKRYKSIRLPDPVWDR